MYKYEFDKNLCWYKNKCKKANTTKCNSNCIKYMEMDYLIKTSGIPKYAQYRNNLIPTQIDLNSFKFLTEIQQDIVNFVNNGENLYIYSKNFGNGKTTWSIKLMQQYFNNIWAGNGFITRGLFIHVPTFLTKIKETISKSDIEFEELKTLLPNVDLVIWDDIGANKLSEYDYNNLATYIEQRRLNNKSNIFTGNLTENELKIALGNRLTSRIWNGSSLVEFKGHDRRGGNI